MSNFFQLINISKTFEVNKKVKVLKNLTFNFKKGKIYSIVGPSGSGKSTLLATLEKAGFNVIAEPVENLWGQYLPQLYQNPQRWFVTISLFF